MADVSLPHLTVKQIQGLATEQSFDRGKQYFRQGAIFNAIRQGMNLRADCQGSELYHVNVTLNDTGVAASDCSCPYDWGGICKHLVALLLAYVHQPDSFQVIPPMAELLANRSQDELKQLIEKMVQRYPDLLYLVEISTPQPTGQPIDVSIYRRKARSALKRDDTTEILHGLEGIEDAAAQLQERQDWVNAGAIYQLLVEEIIAAYDDEMQSIDYDGDLSCVNQDAIANLVVCLEQATAIDAETRQHWLNTLLNAELKDIELGGMDFGYGAEEALLNLATEEEWQTLETIILEQIEQQQDWGRAQLVELLTSWYRHSGKTATAKQLLRRLGTPQQQAFFLVEEGQFAAAIAIATDHFSSMPGTVTRFADALVEANQPDLALQYITEQHQAENYYGYSSWLSNFHRNHGNPQLALDLDYQQFVARPSFESYLSLRELAQSLGSWDDLRPKLLQHLETAKRTDVLIDVAVEAGDHDRALQLLSLNNNRMNSHQTAKVAKAIESSHPDQAIYLYTMLAEAAIGQRGRSAYQTAANYLKPIKALKSAKDWLAFITSLRSTYSRLPALQDELNRAGL